MGFLHCVPLWSCEIGPWSIFFGPRPSSFSRLTLPETKPYQSTLLKTLCQINVQQTCPKPADGYQDVPDEPKRPSLAGTFTFMEAR